MKRDYWAQHDHLVNQMAKVVQFILRKPLRRIQIWGTLQTIRNKALFLILLLLMLSILRNSLIKDLHHEIPQKHTKLVDIRSWLRNMWSTTTVPEAHLHFMAVKTKPYLQPKTVLFHKKMRQYKHQLLQPLPWILIQVIPIIIRPKVLLSIKWKAKISMSIQCINSNPKTHISCLAKIIYSKNLRHVKTRKETAVSRITKI
jgi:hypothetical protein